MFIVYRYNRRLNKSFILYSSLFLPTSQAHILIQIKYFQNCYYNSQEYIYLSNKNNFIISLHFLRSQIIEFLLARERKTLNVRDDLWRDDLWRSGFTLWVDQLGMIT